MFNKCIARAHFEVVGSYEGFPFEYLGNIKITEEEFYRLVGFPYNNSITATEFFELTKSAYGKDKVAISKIRSLPEKDRFSLTKSHKLSTVKHAPLVRMLAAYFRENDTLQLSIQDKMTPLSELLDNFATATKSAESLSAILSDSNFKAVMDVFTPEIVYGKGIKPVIGRGKFIVPVKLSPSEKEDLKTSAIVHAITHFLDVPSHIYFNLLERMPQAQIVTTPRYLEVVAWSHQLNTTVKGLYELCGFEYINRVDFYHKHKALVYKVGADSYSFINKNSYSSKASCTVRAKHINYLSKNNLLGQVIWTDKFEPFVVHEGSELPLVEVLGGQGV